MVGGLVQRRDAPSAAKQRLRHEPRVLAASQHVAFFPDVAAAKAEAVDDGAAIERDLALRVIT